MQVVVGNHAKVSATHSALVFKIRCWTQVQAFNGVWGPCATDVRFFVDDYLGARWGEGRSIEFERSIHVGLSGELGVDKQSS
jgi:hypothetical protein